MWPKKSSSERSKNGVKMKGLFKLILKAGLDNPRSRKSIFYLVFHRWNNSSIKVILNQLENLNIEQRYSHRIKYWVPKKTGQNQITEKNFVSSQTQRLLSALSPTPKIHPGILSGIHPPNSFLSINICLNFTYFQHFLMEGAAFSLISAKGWAELCW